MNRKDRIARLPQSVKNNLRHELEKIALCNSTELLKYSKNLHKKKRGLDTFVMLLLLEATDARRVFINGGQELKEECSNQRAIKDFIKDKR